MGDVLTKEYLAKIKKELDVADREKWIELGYKYKPLWLNDFEIQLLLDEGLLSEVPKDWKEYTTPAYRDWHPVYFYEALGALIVTSDWSKFRQLKRGEE